MQKKTTLAIFLLLMSAILASGFQTTIEWLKYTSVEGRYNVLLPQQPKLTTQDGTAASGEKLKQYMAQAGDSDSFYFLAYFDYDTGMTFSLDKARDGVVEGVKGTLLEQQAISMGGYSGREFKIAASNQNIDILMRVRVYDVAGRVYILQHLFRKSNDTPKIAEKTTKFFDSFKVTLSK